MDTKEETLRHRCDFVIGWDAALKHKHCYNDPESRDLIARAMYPLPKIKVHRTRTIDGYEFRCFLGAIQFNSKSKGWTYIDQMCWTLNGSNVSPTAEYIMLWADLLNNPYEMEEDNT